ncbi:MAG: YdeI/OmpD-associated family protein [Flavisolibacter sp.]
MPLSLAKKLRIRENDTLLGINIPTGFAKTIDLPDGVKITSSSKNYKQIHWFVKNRAEMEKELSKVISLLKDETICWIYYPKGSSGIQTDLTRDKGWDKLLKNEKMQWINLISFDDTWSAFGMRLKTSDDKEKETKPKEERAVFQYIDPVKKTIRLPSDFEKELKGHKKENEFFNGLSFTNKKEYVEWIVSAKREETRSSRINESISRLSKSWKNPSNR